jgi:hypothetical protein
MIIDELNVVRDSFRPTKTDTPPIVDANTELANAVSFQSLKAIARRDSQIIEPAGDFKLPELSTRNLGNTDKLLDTPAFGKSLGVFALKRPDHEVHINA